jgi:threonine/homoserine/homoserine lactone efflux protein
VSFFVQFIDVNAKAPGVAFFILALTLEVISLLYELFDLSPARLSPATLKPARSWPNLATA